MAEEKRAEFRPLTIHRCHSMRKKPFLTGMQAGSGREALTATQKARRINFDALIYGTFAEIGAGQEVAREFFHAGGASGTIAKSISAYDMVFSDAIYGKSRGMCRASVLNLMLDHEYGLLVERLSGVRGIDRTSFFVSQIRLRPATTRYPTRRTAGWASGFKLRLRPKPSEIVLHVRMWDKGLCPAATGSRHRRGQSDLRRSLSSLRPKRLMSRCKTASVRTE